MNNVILPSEADAAMVLSLYRGLIKATPSMRSISEEVASAHGITVDQIRGRPISRKHVLARHEAFARCYETGRFSLPQIGRFFGGRDHTTVLHGVRRHYQRCGEARE